MIRNECQMVVRPGPEKTCEIRLTQGFPKRYKAAFTAFLLAGKNAAIFEINHTAKIDGDLMLLIRFLYVAGDSAQGK